MKSSSKTRIKYLRFTAIYGVLMLCVVIFISLENKNTQIINSIETVTEEKISTEVDYIYVRPDEVPMDTQKEDEVYTVKQHGGKIGIFLSDGTLIQTLDTNIKTLPEADKRLLEEGFEVVGKSQLNSIIEDYTE